MAAKILVVEDDRDMAEAIRLTLENAGYQVVNAYNPDEAWEKVSAEKTRFDRLGHHDADWD